MSPPDNGPNESLPLPDCLWITACLGLLAVAQKNWQWLRVTAIREHNNNRVHTKSKKRLLLQLPTKYPLQCIHNINQCNAYRLCELRASICQYFACVLLAAVMCIHYCVCIKRMKFKNTYIICGCGICVCTIRLIATAQNMSWCKGKRLQHLCIHKFDPSSHWFTCLCGKQEQVPLQKMAQLTTQLFHFSDEPKQIICCMKGPCNG